MNGDPILEMYIYESTQMIEQTESIILDCELAEAFSMQSINEIFRNMHTLKGSSAMMQYMNIADVAHAIEDLFHILREQQPEGIDFPVLFDLVLQSVDFFKSELMKVSQQLPVDGNAEHLIAEIQQLLFRMKESISISSELELTSAAGHDPNKEAFPLQDQSSSDNEATSNIYHAIIHFYEDAAMENVRAYQLVHHLSEFTGKIIYQPEQLLEQEDSSEQIRDYGFQIIFESDSSYEVMHELLMKTSYLLSLELYPLDKWPEEFAVAVNEEQSLAHDTTDQASILPFSQEIVINLQMDNEERIETLQESDTRQPSLDQKQLETASERSIKPFDEKLAVVDSALSSSAVGKANKQQATISSPMISVHLEKLDRLLDLVGELVISEAMIHNLEGSYFNTDESPLYKATSQLRKITAELQDTVMSIRMIPLTATFHKMRRVARDMSRKLSKDIEFIIIGDETEIDKTVIDQISDPLMHLVRNAIDHGIEDSALRAASNKPSHGTIVLEAQNVGSDVLVMVKDDGKGLNKQKIIEKAIKQGIISPQDREMSDRDAFNLIFQPGLSTQEQITEFSGRGVGMDVVSSNIQQVGGVIYIDSVAGEGTTVTMKIPLTLAIIDGMNVRAFEQNYTIPIHSITESFRPQAKDILRDPSGNPMTMVRGECYPILSLHERYHSYSEPLDYTQGILIMVEQDDMKLCLFVDELLGQQQVVIKPLPAYLKQFNYKNNGLAGCTLLGDGSISLILNMSELIGFSHHTASSDSY